MSTFPEKQGDPAERERRLLGFGRAIVEACPADETEVLLADGREFLTRFAGNRIHQNVGAEEASAVVRVVIDRRVGVATADSLEDDALAAARDAALAIAEASEPDPDWPGLPGRRPVKPVKAYHPATALATARTRADFAAAIIAAAREKGGEAAGIIQTEEGSLAVVNSHGVGVVTSQTRAETNALVTCEDGSGWAEGVAMRLSDLDADRVGKRAALTAAKSRDPRPLDPGRYDVVLEPSAVAEWVQYLAYVALSGKDFDEGQSPLAGRLGDKVTGEQVTLWDNARDRRTLPQPFDYEGQPAKRLSLIKNGVAEGVATNHYRARRLGKRTSTGHALPASSSYECMPMHLFMKGGDATAKQLVGELERGLLVTRFHYTNILDPMQTVLTGMTRDGTFWVENGTIVHPVRNLRYTENVLAALARSDGMSKRLTRVPGPCLVPTVRVRGVQFSGATEF
jgi:predicted Zn-dependent protease